MRYVKCIYSLAQVVVLGTGKKSLEAKVKALEQQFPSVAKGIVKFSTPLAHLINAGGASHLSQSSCNTFGCNVHLTCGLPSCHRRGLPAGAQPLRALRPDPAPGHAVRHGAPGVVHRRPCGHGQRGAAVIQSHTLLALQHYHTLVSPESCMPPAALCSCHDSVHALSHVIGTICH